MPTTIFLQESMFGTTERTLLEADTLEASVFRYESGVAAVRLRNELGELVLLPFQGQQIWSASFRGRNITMRSMFEQPRATRSYLETYGGFLLHCGFTAMGVPAAGDTHPLHGELPNAPYDRAFLLIGRDDRGSYIGLGGSYQHTVAFSYNYRAEPLVKLYAGSSLFTIDLDITNLKRTDMEYLYMAHANFRPVDHGRLVYSAQCTPASVRVRTSIPSHVRPGPQYAAFLGELSEHPERHNVLKPGLAFDPEVVFFIIPCRCTQMAAPTISATAQQSSTKACAGSAAPRTRTRWGWCCLLPPSQRASAQKKPRATSSGSLPARRTAAL